MSAGLPVSPHSTSVTRSGCAPGTGAPPRSSPAPLATPASGPGRLSRGYAAAVVWRRLATSHRERGGDHRRTRPRPATTAGPPGRSPRPWRLPQGAQPGPRARTPSRSPSRVVHAHHPRRSTGQRPRSHYHGIGPAVLPKRHPPPATVDPSSSTGRLGFRAGTPSPAASVSPLHVWHGLIQPPPGYGRMVVTYPQLLAFALTAFVLS